MNFRLLALGILFLLSCGSEDTSEPTISPAALSYMNSILKIMEDNSINKDEIDWVAFRAEVLAQIENAQTIGETFLGIERALTLLGDNHSFYISAANQFVSGEGDLDCVFNSFQELNVPNNIGYVRVDAFSDGDPSAIINFANAIHTDIRIQDQSDLIGWIVDLRENSGGNMWPMLAGLGSLLGDGIHGFFIDPDGNQTPWSYSNGTSFSGTFGITSVDNPYNLRNSDLPIAVLLSNGVASSGEAIAISFTELENVKSFGAATCGLSTSNNTYTLSDGALLLVTTAYMADRNKVMYGGPIEPDSIVGTNQILQASIEFIEG